MRKCQYIMNNNTKIILFYKFTTYHLLLGFFFWIFAMSRQKIKVTEFDSCVRRCDSEEKSKFTLKLLRFRSDNSQ